MKRPAVDLSSLTAETAAPMQEAVQRAARPVPQLVKDEAPPKPAEAPVMKAAAVEAPVDPAPRVGKSAKPEAVRTENLVSLGFKISPAFKKRFKQRAANAELKLNELLFEALDVWEQKNKHRL